ncbi:hypothetical protein JHK85_018942 [Glycine max]|nr:hypothetical protein JHK85_018942 [Glycine max]
MCSMCRYCGVGLSESNFDNNQQGHESSLKLNVKVSIRPCKSCGEKLEQANVKWHSTSPYATPLISLTTYGDIFKTNILGCPCVMISSPEAARIVLVTHAHLFKPIYPPSKEKLIGPEAVFFQQGAYHSMLKSLVQASFLPSTIKHSISEVKRIVIKMVPTWTNKTINTLQEMKKYAFEVAAISAFGEIKELEMEEIRELYCCLEKGYNSYPLHVPGTSYWKAMKQRTLASSPSIQPHDVEELPDSNFQVREEISLNEGVAVREERHWSHCEETRYLGWVMVAEEPSFFGSVELKSAFCSWS